MIPVMHSLGFGNLKPSELWMCDVLEKLIPLKRGLFIDIGVNLGQTLVKLKLVDRSIDYMGFDPNPVCIYYTRQLVEENRYTNVTLVPAGISSNNELKVLNFYTDGASESSASMVNNFRPQNEVLRQELVACYAFDQIERVIPHKEVGIIKIDVEGAELEVLMGISKMLALKRPFVLVEILPVYSQAFSDRWERQQQFEQIVHTLNYKIYRIKKNGESFDAFYLVETIGVHDNLDDCDYFLCPQEAIPNLA